MRWLNELMDELMDFTHLEDLGWTRRQISRAEGDGTLTKVGRGLWTTPGDPSRRARHLRATQAVLHASHPDTVASHVSASALWGLPLNGDLSTVWVTGEGRGGGRVQPGVHRVRAPLTPRDVTEANGLRVTSIARTVADVARTRDHVEAVMVADAALRQGLARTDLDDMLDGMTRWPGTARARRAISFADPLAEPPYESWTRVLLRRMGMPAPTLQHKVFTPSGQFVARLDFAFVEWGLGIEYDGEGKYDELAATSSPGEVFAREKRRDRALAALGWHMLHLSKQDVHDWQQFQTVVRQAVPVARLQSRAA